MNVNIPKTGQGFIRQSVEGCEKYAYFIPSRKNVFSGMPCGLLGRTGRLDLISPGNEESLGDFQGETTRVEEKVEVLKEADAERYPPP